MLVGRSFPVKGISHLVNKLGRKKVVVQLVTKSTKGDLRFHLAVPVAAGASFELTSGPLPLAAGKENVSPTGSEGER